MAFEHSEIVAAPLVQHPRYVDTADEHWDENARFIAATREAAPRIMRAGPKLEPLLLGDDERAVLERWTRRANSAQALA
ncbi:hypothetical protein ACIQCF_39640, partial [Streptomyces sp. NPDC088353]